MKKVIFFILFNSCFFIAFSQENEKKIGKEFCACYNNILNKELNEAAKKSEFENCSILIIKMVAESSNEINDVIQKEAYKKELLKRVYDYVSLNCENIEKEIVSFNTKRQTSSDLLKNRSICKKILSEGTFKMLGINEEVIITRNKNVNRVEFTASGLYSEYLIKWIDECSYSLTLKSSNRPDIKPGSSMIVRVIDISGIIIDFDVDVEDDTFPQKMKKLN